MAFSISKHLICYIHQHLICYRNASTRLIGGQSCSIDGGICRAQALPCSAYCARHVAKCEEQHLFRHCTAKFADNTQCSVPVFDVRHELPLCREHALKRVHCVARLFKEYFFWHDIFLIIIFLRTIIIR